MTNATTAGSARAGFAHDDLCQQPMPELERCYMGMSRMLAFQSNPGEGAPNQSRGKYTLPPVEIPATGHGFRLLPVPTNAIPGWPARIAYWATN